MSNVFYLFICAFRFLFSIQTQVRPLSSYIVCAYIETTLILIGLSHIRVSTHVSTAYRDTKGTSHVRRRYVDIRSAYSSIRSSYSSYAEVLRFFLCVHLKIRSTYEAGPIRRTYVTHTWYIRKQRGRYVVGT